MHPSVVASATPRWNRGEERAREKDEAVSTVVTARDIHAHVIHTFLPPAGMDFPRGIRLPGQLHYRRSSSSAVRANKFTWLDDEKNYYRAPIVVFPRAHQALTRLLAACAGDEKNYGSFIPRSADYQREREAGEVSP